MAPTVCVTEETTVDAFIHRRRGSENDTKRRRRFALEEMLRTGTIVETLLPPREYCSRRLDYADTVPNCSVVKADRSGGYPTNVDESYREFFERRRDLLSIVIRTIILIRRNRILQRRLNALWAETRWFLSSVSNNPESQQRRLQVLSHSEDLPFTKTVSTLSPPLDIDSRDSFHGIISSRDIDDESSSSDNSEDSGMNEC